jgi:AraC-like DNA-binding protein
MFGFAVLSSPTLRRALQIAQRYRRLGSPLARSRFTEEGRQAKWRFEPISHPRLIGRLYEFVVRLQMSALIAFGEDLMGADPPLVESAAFPFDLETDGGAVFKLLTGVEAVRAPGPEAWLRIESARLDQPTRLGTPAVNRMLLQICDEQIASLRKREGLAGRLRTILITNGCRILGLHAAAERLGMTERSLRRRLVGEGTSFRAVHDDVQLQAAIGYLRDTELSMESIAEALGFSEAGSFRRAFRRWTGDAPGQYRGV